MTPVTRYALIAAVALMSAAAGWQFNRHTAPTTKPQIAPGASAALMALALPDPDGTTQAIEQWRGKVLILNFWATWCPPCLREIPDFAKVSQAFADAPVQFVGISIDSADKVRAFGDRLDCRKFVTNNTDAAFGNAAGRLNGYRARHREGRGNHEFFQHFISP